MRAGVMQLARRHGQAAVYVVEGAVAASGGGGEAAAHHREEDGGESVTRGGGKCGGDDDGVVWRLAVVPCFPGLDGLASEDVATVVRATPQEMPASPD